MLEIALYSLFYCKTVKIDMDSADTGDKDMMIFTNIGKIIITPEFNVATSEFFTLHRDKFDENEDENKHEYMQLFEEYVSLSDKALMAKIKEEYGVTDDDLASFLGSF